MLTTTFWRRRAQLSILGPVLLLGATLAAQQAAAVPVPPVGAPVLPIPTGLQEVFAGTRLPADLDSLRRIEAHVQALEAKVRPATVFLGGATGVIIEGGLVLTAGHVSRQAGRNLQLVLQDGRRIRARSLGLNHGTDTGLLRILDEGDYPSLPLGDSKAMAKGSWCMMLGFPGGARAGERPPLRLGRVLLVRERGYLVSDCCMSAGDSGGPLLDMGGRIIGINSRISRDLANNMHTPVHLFRREWVALLNEEVKGRSRRARSGRARGPAGWMGVEIEPNSKPAKVAKVTPGSPAARAGVEVGDRLLRLGGRRLLSWRSVARALRRHRPGQTVALRIQRQGAEPRDLDLKLSAVPKTQRTPETPKEQKK